MADREFSIADKYHPGANPTNVYEFVRTIRARRSELDFLIVLLHEGVQHFQFPTPELQGRCRFFVEEGADAVICQHSHCPGCYEFYRGRPIVYGQGDLLSDSKSSLKDDTGFIVKLELGHSIQMSVITYRQLPSGGVRRMTKPENDVFVESLEQRNRLLHDPDALEREWRKHCRSLRDTYYARIKGYNRWFRILNGKFHFIEQINAGRAAILLNLVRCSAHREALETIFSDIISDKSN
jgi:poly-gamma-glutamate synthesis protein (capsule biosynthesis protein)